MLPELVAVSVVIPDVPPRIKVALIACVNPPVPVKSVLTVKVLLLISERLLRLRSVC